MKRKTEREAFEVWVKSHWNNSKEALAKDEHGYMMIIIEAYWTCWKAAWQASARRRKK